MSKSANMTMSTTTQMTITEPTMSTPSGINLFIINNIDHFERSLYILYVIIFILGVVGNSIVIYVLMSSIFLSRPANAGGGGHNRRATTTTVAQTTTVRNVGQSTPVIGRTANQSSFRQMVKSGSERDSTTKSPTSPTDANNQSKRSVPSLGAAATTPAGAANYLSVDEEMPRRASACAFNDAVNINHVSDRSNMKDFKQVRLLFLTIIRLIF